MDKHLLSKIVNGKILDYNYKKLQENQYAFYIGDILIGQVFKMRSGWSSVINFRPCITVGVVDGFKTRYAASAYMLQCIDLEKKNTPTV